MNLKFEAMPAGKRLPPPQQLCSGVRDDLSAVVLDPDCRSAGVGSQGGQEAAPARRPSSRHRCRGANYPAGRAAKVDGVGRRSLKPGVGRVRGTQADFTSTEVVYGASSVSCWTEPPKGGSRRRRPTYDQDECAAWRLDVRSGRRVVVHPTRGSPGPPSRPGQGDPRPSDPC